MTISIICPNKDPKPWYLALKDIDSTLDIQIWPTEIDKEKVSFALCWNQPVGLFNNYSNLQCICSMGAGIDHLLKDPLMPKDLPVIRLVDPSMAQDMADYVTTTVMYFQQNLDLYRDHQNQEMWLPQPTISIDETTVGIMGLGKLGKHTAKHLAKIGFSVNGWSRSEKNIGRVKTYFGSDQLHDFTRDLDILVCLLPLTEETKGILNLTLFKALPNNACIINVARGDHLVEGDLLIALEGGILRGACIDVFSSEPLALDHPFWKNQKILITPHCSSVTDPVSVAPQIVKNYRLMQAGKPLNHQINVERGY